MNDAAIRMSKARTRLLLDSPWFGSLSMRLQVAESSCETMRTDGTKLEYNAEFVDGLSEAELVAVLAHETLHCALLHPYRTNGRDIKQWNEAADYAVNDLLVKQGFTLPDGALIDAQYAGMAAEQIYGKLGRDKQPDSGQSGPSGPSKSPTGEFVSADGQSSPDGQENGQNGPSQPSMSSTDWMVAAEQATAVASKAGVMDGDTARAAKAIRPSEANWREILRRFIEQTIPSDYSWTSPNRRYISEGIYLPGTVKENTPKLVVGIDTSGSISQGILNIFASELTAILHEVRPESIDVIYCDTRVNHIETFTPDDAVIELTARGGGGTRFSPVFEHVAESGEYPACLIYFTDLECSDVPTEPDYPVLWVTDESSELTGPFGETVRLSQWE